MVIDNGSESGTYKDEAARQVALCKRSRLAERSTAATTDDQKETANEHELDGPIRVNWCPFVVRKFFAKLRELQPQ
jgi:hypothetical protein